MLFLLLACASPCGLSFAESPFPGQTFTYSDPAIDVDALTTDGAGNPLFRGDSLIVVKDMSSVDLSRPSFVFFSTGSSCVDSDVYPVIAVYEDGRWSTIPFTGAKNHYWSHVYRGYRDRDHLYALTSGYCGDPFGQLYLYRTFDGGRSWTVSLIRLPYYLARFLSFRMEPDGSGEITVETVNDADPIGGHYVYRTTDFGETWSEPTFSENTLAIPARPGGFVSVDMLTAIREALTAAREQTPVSKIMEDIAAEYERYRERR